MKLFFELYLKFIKPNFTILSIFNLKKGKDGVWLEKTDTLAPNSIVEYKYNRKNLKYYFIGGDWPPFFKRRKRINKVIYDEKDITQEVLKFAGPRKCDFNPLSLLRITKKPRLRFFYKKSLVHIEWCDFMEIGKIDNSKLFIYCS
jgi:hypothetical protein